MQTVTRLTEIFRPHHYQLTLDTDRLAKTFKGTVVINGESLTDGAFRVHVKDLTIDTVIIDGHSANYRQDINDELELSLDKLLAGQHVVVIGFSGILNDQMHGMYPCYYVHEGVKKQLIATQFESHHAREVFPCIDEPEAKATFDVTLITEPDVAVLGNMPIVQQATEDGKLATTFDTTPRMSSYLLAWVYGELQKKTATTKSGVEVGIWATPAQPAASLDFALEAAVKTTEFFEEYFDTPYPLPKSDHVALPDFSSGAMENWGLITYRETTLLADPKTTGISTKRLVSEVIAHELSHQWFGNLVTMKWWNNLWLNESFANVMAYIAVDAMRPDWGMWLEYASSDTVMALRRDAVDGVQAVQVDVHHPDEISSLFDPAIVYAKGGRLVRMLEHYIGTDAFRAGLTSYFKKYAYQNTEADDLWAEMSEASGKNVTDLMHAWISQSGYPVVHVLPTGLRQEQFFIGPHQQSTKLWPIVLNATVGGDIPALLETTELTLPISTDVRLNTGDTSHFITHYELAHLATIIEKLTTLTPIDRLQLLDEQTLLARSGVISSAELIPLLDAYANETSDDVWNIVAMTLGELKKFVETDQTTELKLRALAGVLATNEYTRLGWEANSGEPDTDTKLRATAIGLMAYSEDEAVITKAIELYSTTELASLDPELRSLIISIVCRHSTDDAIPLALIEQYKTTHSAELQNDICVGITSTRNKRIIDTLLANLTNNEIVRSQDVARWFVYLIRGRESRTATWQWVRDNWKWIEQTFGGDKSFDDYPRYAATGLSTRQQLDEYKAFFEPKQSVPALTRVIALGISEIEARVELLERDGDAVRTALLNL